VVARYRVDAAQAGDVLQDAFLQYRAKLRDGRVDRPSLSHLRAFVRFCVLDAMRDARRLVALDEIAPPGPPADPEAAILRKLLVDHALDRLDRRCAYLLRARYFWGQTSAEIAGALALETGNVDVSLHRCRAKLRRALTEVSASVGRAR
jgi:RNA polymerase sigma factor (sigma-70 family)